MSNFFEKFPKIAYRFGNNESPVEFQNLSVYIDAIDQVKEYASFYQNYQIKSGERPDHVSHILYDNANYGWTFWLMNDHLRESGWPMDNSQVYVKAQEFYPNVALRTTGVTFDIINGDNKPLCASVNFVEGGYLWFTEITQLINPLATNPKEQIGKIMRIDQDLGLMHVEVAVKPTGTIVQAISKEDYDNITKGVITAPVTPLEELNIVETYDQWDAPHHYEDTYGEWVTPTYSSTAPYPFDWTSVTTEQSVSYFQRLREENDKARSIRVIKRDVMPQVIAEYNRLLLRR